HERIRLLPRLHVHRLAVVVAIEEYRSRGAGDVERAINERIAARFEDLGGKSSSPEQTAQVLGVAPDVRAVGGDVGNRERLEQLTDDLFLMRVDVSRHAGGEGGG